MITPRDIANADQAGKFLVDHLPAIYWGLFKNLVKEGFHNREALEIVKTNILSQGSAPVMLLPLPFDNDRSEVGETKDEEGSY